MGLTDRIWIKGISCRARLGVPDWERKRPQEISIDVGLELDLAASGRSDDFRDTADYWAVEKRVREVAEGAPFRLVERLAELAARAALEADSRVQGVFVAVHKRPASMPKTLEVVVEITRRRRRPR